VSLYNAPVRSFWPSVIATAAAVIVVAATAAQAQPPVARPQPPPAVPGTRTPATTPAPAPATVQPANPGRAAAEGTADQPVSAEADAPPSESQLGVPVFPTAQYLGSYDAGRGQSFYLYGSTQAFADLVAYYRNVLKDRGELVFEEPATHMFEVGKFKEAEVAFPPGVTIKDYAGGGSPGFQNPKPGAAPPYFRTVIQIVPPPPGLAGRRSP
jgi:hypothetical protein